MDEPYIFIPKKKTNKGFDRNELKLFQSPKQQEVKNNNEREKAFQKHKLEPKKKGRVNKSQLEIRWKESSQHIIHRLLCSYKVSYKRKTKKQKKMERRKWQCKQWIDRGLILEKSRWRENVCSCLLI